MCRGGATAARASAELLCSYVEDGGYCSLLMGKQRRDAGAKMLVKQREYVKQKVIQTNRSLGLSKLTKENQKKQR